MWLVASFGHKTKFAHFFEEVLAHLLVSRCSIESASFKDNSDLLLDRIVRVFAKYNRRRNAIFAIGLKELDLDYAHKIVETLEEYFVKKSEIQSQ